ncbi:hypothetical protein RRG08_001177 [Elysia crispata]|uniref:Uncharacterized protein n=1 Tax=Elysia crispata TaxID=231223 RepID=A0AAE1E6V1_9GAST|nr:hypothetical protein RRG08_001177 [Elysia crispata]
MDHLLAFNLQLIKDFMNATTHSRTGSDLKGAASDQPVGAHCRHLLGQGCLGASALAGGPPSLEVLKYHPTLSRKHFSPSCNERSFKRAIDTINFRKHRKHTSKTSVMSIGHILQSQETQETHQQDISFGDRSHSSTVRKHRKHTSKTSVLSIHHTLPQLGNTGNTPARHQ